MKIILNYNYLKDLVKLKIFLAGLTSQWQTRNLIGCNKNIGDNFIMLN